MRTESVLRVCRFALLVAAVAIVADAALYVRRVSGPVVLPSLPPPQPVAAPVAAPEPRPLSLGTVRDVRAWTQPAPATEPVRACPGEARCYELCRDVAWPHPAPFRVVPAFRDGRALGIRLASARPGTLEAVGLARDDVIRGMDELDFGRMDELSRAAERYRGADAVTLHVLRGDETFDLAFRLVPCPR